MVGVRGGRAQFPHPSAGPAGQLAGGRRGAVEDGIDNPLPKVPEFLRFQENLKGWLAETPVPDQLTVIGDYQS
ncbi:hypothetical protein FAGKG844_390017 [Frankia sp. AgKG'84/4]|nr:hypothetical protein [Frankia sp. AgKG'84/4]